MYAYNVSTIETELSSYNRQLSPSYLLDAGTEVELITLTF